MHGKNVPLKELLRLSSAKTSKRVRLLAYLNQVVTCEPGAVSTHADVAQINRYDACDQLGIMIYHDMQYAQGGHAPANTTDQTKELQHQIRRLASHPAIVMWDGCASLRTSVHVHLYTRSLVNLVLCMAERFGCGVFLFFFAWM